MISCNDRNDNSQFSCHHIPWMLRHFSPSSSCSPVFFFEFCEQNYNNNLINPLVSPQKINGDYLDKRLKCCWYFQAKVSNIFCVQLLKCESVQPLIAIYHSTLTALGSQAYWRHLRGHRDVVHGIFSHKFLTFYRQKEIIGRVIDNQDTKQLQLYM